jgi:hypothetical protein
VVVGVARHEAAASDEVDGLDPGHDLHDVREVRDPGRAGQLVCESEARRWRVRKMIQAPTGRGVGTQRARTQRRLIQEYRVTRGISRAASACIVDSFTSSLSCSMIVL